MDLDSLPLEAFIEILMRTDGVTLGRCRRVCTKWLDIIDKYDCIWEKMCFNEYECSSAVAKKKCGKECKWYHIYKNLSMWTKVSLFVPKIREFYKFSLQDKNHALDIDYGVLPLRDTRGIVLYDASTLKHIPVAVPEKDCIRIANNDHATIIQLKCGILLQRTVEDSTYMTEAFFIAENFVLHKKDLYFFSKRDVFICDLDLKNLESRLIVRCEFDIKEIQYYRGRMCIFTYCGKIVTIGKKRTITVKAISCPPEWVKHIKHIYAINETNFVCFSRNLFKIETDKHWHMYIEFPPITAIFFYGDFVLIGTRVGEILLYRLSRQQGEEVPFFEKIAEMPGNSFAVHLDVCERRSGPVIIVGTFSEILLLEIDFFPHVSKNICY